MSAEILNRWTGPRTIIKKLDGNGSNKGRPKKQPIECSPKPKKNRSNFKGTHSPAVAAGLRLVASGVSIRNAAKLAGCSFGGLAKAIARKRKEAQK